MYVPSSLLPTPIHPNHKYTHPSPLSSGQDMPKAAHQALVQPAGLTHTRKRRSESLHFVCLPRRTAWEPASQDPFTLHELRVPYVRARQDRQHRSSCPATGGAVWTPDSGLGAFPNLEARHDLRRPDPGSTPAFTGIPDRQWVMTGSKGKVDAGSGSRRASCVWWLDVRNGPGIGCTNVQRSNTRSAGIHGGRWRAVSPPASARQSCFAVNVCLRRMQQASGYHGLSFDMSTLRKHLSINAKGSRSAGATWDDRLSRIRRGLVHRLNGILPASYNL
ncbi:hypothetical protein CVT26_007862 [Gymnopilus dilepis]|uniref:Uncharacterized protein n=1 Tax=Gymnopilus dilepis TaxID=231916 RepID=A0A409YK91_9AGAR|nr:hypothetical protein CVT26_007862 [Gymnopilus dilepis]